ncbi:MAG TPA: N-acetylmuramoyl-L-alanine amidase [Longimicrobium sp.]|nr:N-acetylmuramoyl-L-alanine amidase [Longimicrobium sp.]
MRALVPWTLIAAALGACDRASAARPEAPGAAAAQRASAQPSAPVPSLAPADTPVIAIDPGHPSETSAGTSHHGVAEVQVAWQVAERLRDLLAAEGYRVVMTKTRVDQVVHNEERARIANRAGAALMVRLHCDAAAGSGFALYHPDRKGTVRGVTGPADSVIAASRRAAEALHGGMAEVLRGTLHDGGIRGDSRTAVGARQGALTGSIFSEVPVVTIEMVVLTSRSDAAFIASDSGQAQMARAIAAGVQRFVPLTAPSAPAGRDSTPQGR